VSGSEVDDCDPLAGAVPEICQDGIDNDCDGTVDDGCPGVTTTTTCPVPELIAPIGGGKAPLGEVFSWTPADSGANYNLLVYSEKKNAIANSMWVGSDACSTGTCYATLGSALATGRNWWWLNVDYGDPLCGFVEQPGAKVNLITVVGCTDVPTLTYPANGGTRSVGHTFDFQANGSDWYQLMVYTNGRGITVSYWDEALNVCTGSSCHMNTGYTLPFGSMNWWWLNTYSAACGYKVQPGGLVNGFTQQ